MLFKPKTLPKLALPLNPEEFDALLDEIMWRYRQFTDRNHVKAVVAVSISHLPHDQGYSTYEYFEACIRKSLANSVAHWVRETMKHDAQVDQLESLVRNDPNNNQARDELTKAADAGSVRATVALERLDPKPEAAVSAPPLRLVPDEEK